MVTIKNLFDKYENSSKWLLICPVLENGQVKLRCFMSKTNNGVFQNCYTYKANLEILLKFVQSNSFGQAYNGLIKYRQQRIGFQDKPNKETKEFKKQDIIECMIKGRTKMLLDVITLLQSRHGIITNMEQLVEHKRKKELEAEFDAFYNY